MTQGLLNQISPGLLAPHRVSQDPNRPKCPSGTPGSPGIRVRPLAAGGDSGEPVKRTSESRRVTVRACSRFDANEYRPQHECRQCGLDFFKCGVDRIEK